MYHNILSSATQSVLNPTHCPLAYPTFPKLIYEVITADWVKSFAEFKVHYPLLSPHLHSQFWLMCIPIVSNLCNHSLYSPFSFSFSLFLIQAMRDLKTTTEYLFQEKQQLSFRISAWNFLLTITVSGLLFLHISMYDYINTLHIFFATNLEVKKYIQICFFPYSADLLQSLWIT